MTTSNRTAATSGRRAMVWGILGLAACGGATPSPPASSASYPTPETRDAPAASTPAETNTCSRDGVDGGECNLIRDVGKPITPTCTSGAVPVGTGGTIQDGTYVLVAETYFNLAHCPTTPVGGTLAIAGNCYQMVAHAVAEARSAEMRISSTASVQGSHIIMNATCMSMPGAVDAPTKTFTATGSTLTFFAVNAGTGNGNPDRVEFFEKL